jgi:hypothetical protein
LTLTGPELPYEFDVEVDPEEFGIDQIDYIWSSAKDRKPVELRINAVIVREKIKGAVLSDITPSTITAAK